MKVVYDSNRKVSGLWFVPTPQEVLRRYQQAAKSTAKEETPKTPEPRRKTIAKNRIRLVESAAKGVGIWENKWPMIV